MSTAAINRMRADGARNRALLLQKANVLLTADPYTSPEAIAAAAGVHRATLYRHFPRGTRQMLEELRLRLVVVPTACDRADPCEQPCFGATPGCPYTNSEARP